MRRCTEPGCKARCGKGYFQCARHRPKLPQRVVTPEQRQRYNAAARERSLRRNLAVLAGREIL